jgi:hypothetical protein
MDMHMYMCVVERRFVLRTNLWLKLDQDSNVTDE